MEAVVQQPVSVAIEADQSAFQMYGGGVISKLCGSKLDHGVLLVGYGTSEDGMEYWKVKNSWGPTWGENGYVRIERGLSGKGECGIKAMSSYPEVTASGPVPSPTPVPTPPAPTPGPTPPAPTPPAPTPSGCQDDNSYCTNPSTFTPSQDCKFLAKECKKTCDCCGPAPKSWCNGPVSKTDVVV